MSLRASKALCTSADTSCCRSCGWKRNQLPIPAHSRTFAKRNALVRRKAPGILEVEEERRAMRRSLLQATGAATASSSSCETSGTRVGSRVHESYRSYEPYRTYDQPAPQNRN